MPCSSMTDGFDGQIRNLCILLLRPGKIESGARQQMGHLHTYSEQTCLEILPPCPADRLCVYKKIKERKNNMNGSVVLQKTKTELYSL